jgi:hypothetical protein
MRVPAPIFDAAQEECCSIFQQRRAGIEDAIDGIRPIGRAQDRVPFITAEKFRMLLVH